MTCTYLTGQRHAYTRCTEPIARGSYCREHARVCYVDYVPVKVRAPSVKVRVRTGWDEGRVGK